MTIVPNTNAELLIFKKTNPIPKLRIYIDELNNKLTMLILPSSTSYIIIITNVFNVKTLKKYSILYKKGSYITYD